MEAGCGASSPVHLLLIHGRSNPVWADFDRPLSNFLRIPPGPLPPGAH